MNFNSKKMAEREAFMLKPKHQCHSSQWVEWVYGAQSWKEKRLLCESKFVSFYRWTLIIGKMMERKTFVANPKYRYRVSQCGEHDCNGQSQKEWRLLRISMFVLFHEWTLIIWKMVERKTFRANAKPQYRASQCGEYDIVPITKRI